jgi:hypothetical protein
MIELLLNVVPFERSLDMGFLRFIIGIVTFVIAIKLLGILLGIIGFALHLLWIAIVVGFFVLVAWLIYKLVSPRRTETV